MRGKPRHATSKHDESFISHRLAGLKVNSSKVETAVVDTYDRLLDHAGRGVQHGGALHLLGRDPV